LVRLPGGIGHPPAQAHRPLQEVRIKAFLHDGVPKGLDLSADKLRPKQPRFFCLLIIAAFFEQFVSRPRQEPDLLQVVHSAKVQKNAVAENVAEVSRRIRHDFPELPVPEGTVVEPLNGPRHFCHLVYISVNLGVNEFAGQVP
jgi:hypothetical protein